MNEDKSCFALLFFPIFFFVENLFAFCMKKYFSANERKMQADILQLNDDISKAHKKGHFSRKFRGKTHDWSDMQILYERWGTEVVVFGENVKTSDADADIKDLCCIDKNWHIFSIEKWHGILYSLPGNMLKMSIKTNMKVCLFWCMLWKWFQWLLNDNSF